MTSIGSKILVPLNRFSLGYAQALLKDIKPADFARQPKGIDTNHPAFVFGHLAIYPDRLLEMLGRADLARPDAHYVDLFAAGKPCTDDPQGKIYPEMEQIVARFNTRYEALNPVLAEIPNEVFEGVNPNEKHRDRFPTLGMFTAFLVGSHIMMHMGQVSAWRRCMGLPSAM
ncbi:MAG: DinB family protein [Planctomycetota bacterium]|nr:DinB family protein [Planctomycetota bacterium]